MAITKDRDKKKVKKEKTEETKLEILSSSLPARYRPTTFEQLVGQKHIVAQLKGILRDRKLPGAILLAGRSGCGKTTIARIFSRYINCATFNACGVCPSCKTDIYNHPDILEMNMGADGKVDTARELIFKAKIMPRFNVRTIVLDEVHNWTAQAEQSLLKPLEEPPAKTLWVLATTNPEKLKPAVLGRCLKLNLKPITKEEIADKVMEVAKLEGVDFDNKSGRKLVESIANYSDGQVRDALGLLENVLLAYRGDRKANLEAVIESFAGIMESTLDKLAVKCVTACTLRSIKEMLRCAAQAENCRALMMKMRWIIISLLDEYSETMKFQSYNFRDIKAMLKKAEIDTHPKYLVPFMLRLNAVLNTTEQQMNFTNVDERILFTTNLGNFMLDNSYGEK
jgi:DNA polymerase-3 subunit gamma/tau